MFTNKKSGQVFFVAFSVLSMLVSASEDPAFTDVSGGAASTSATASATASTMSSAPGIVLSSPYTRFVDRKCALELSDVAQSMSFADRRLLRSQVGKASVKASRESSSYPVAQVKTIKLARLVGGGTERITCLEWRRVPASDIITQLMNVTALDAEKEFQLSEARRRPDLARDYIRLGYHTHEEIYGSGLLVAAFGCPAIRKVEGATDIFVKQNAYFILILNDFIKKLEMNGYYKR
jgi:hypothetical protein